MLHVYRMNIPCVKKYVFKLCITVSIDVYNPVDQSFQ